jgi:hypothetical protein
LFVLCANTIWQLHWGINYFKHIKHEGWKLWHQWIRPRQEQHHHAYLQHLMEEGHKAFEAYHIDLEELFLSCCEVMQQETVLQDRTLIVFCKPGVPPKVWPNPSPSHNDIQSMINSTLERQAKSTDEPLHRLIEDRDGKKLDTTSINPSSTSCTVSFTLTNPQTSGASASGTTMPNPTAQPMNHFHSQTTIKSLAPTFGMPQQATVSMFGQGYTQTAPSFSMQTLLWPHTPLGPMVEHRCTLAAATKPCTPL